jgi:hypothetical protein
MSVHTLIGACCALVLAIGLSAAGGEAQQEIDPAEFSATITNPLFPLSSVGPKVFEGTDTDPDTGEVLETRLESRVLPGTEVVAGVTVTVLEEQDYEDGELVEVALDYIAQHENGDVYYFGERVDNYEDGELKDHEGSWLAGEDGARPGVIMAASPEVGKTYEQELAPGIAEDKAEVLAVDETVTVPAGTYEGCVKTRDFNPLEPGVEETKWHCRGVGLVKEEGETSLNELVSVGDASLAGAPPDGALSEGEDDGSGVNVWVWFAIAAGVAVIVAVGAGAWLLRLRSGGI